MRRFLASAWFPLLTVLVMAGVSVAAYAMLKPTGDDVGNSQIVSVFKIVGWAIGPAIALLSLILIGILNLVRRIFQMRRVNILHPVVVLMGIVPWLIFSWVIMDEPRFTPIARAIIDFAGRPMLWGSLVATLFAIILSIPLFVGSRENSPQSAKKK